ncbi:MAG: sigma 54 modulation/S30EA ribosomal C-terminal domain-containing protein, partial [Alphaproteobacteria bacterium]|nr:sigma 54 modulation/S30EA ribosomal C-terminal domain-containing protein [Alphaproteobacteria bacterium]
FFEEDVEDEDEIKIVRTKRFAMKPMDVEEACIQ